MKPQRRAIAHLRKFAAMFIPALKLARDHETGGKNFRDCWAAHTPTRPLHPRFSANNENNDRRFRAAFSRRYHTFARK